MLEVAWTHGDQSGLPRPGRVGAVPEVVPTTSHPSIALLPFVTSCDAIGRIGRYTPDPTTPAALSPPIKLISSGPRGRLQLEASFEGPHHEQRATSG
jgi:hypothetical protein